MNVSDATIKLSSSLPLELPPSLSTANEFPTVDDVPAGVDIAGEIVSLHYSDSDASDQESKQKRVAIRQANKVTIIMPLEFSGKDINLEGWIISVADVFDDFSCSRPYKKVFALDKCYEIPESERA